ncbi:MAG: transposase [Phycisphaerae bacterium]
MRKQSLLMKVSARLETFLKPILAEVDKVRRRFVRQAVTGILTSRSLVVTEMARRIHDGTAALDYTAKRLCRELVAETWHLPTLQQRHLDAVASWVGEETPIAVDLTDLAKPRGRQFEYLALVRDGDQDRLQPGYWCLEAYTADGEEPLPLVLQPFSVQDPRTPSQNLVILAALEQLRQTFANRGLYLFDRGFDAGEILNALLDKGMRFLVRLRGDRHLVLDHGVRLPARDIADRLATANVAWRWRPASCRLDAHWIGYLPARLPGRPEPLTLVVALFPGPDGGMMMLLTNRAVASAPQAEHTLRLYAHRWKAEEGIRVLKQEVGLEGFRIRCLEAIRRLVFLALLAIAFLVSISEKTLSLAEQIIRRGQPLRRARGMILYRLARGIRYLFTHLSPPNLAALRRFQNG